MKFALRWAAFVGATKQLVTGQHVYIATSCLHDDCGHCTRGHRQDGKPKRPARCKFCPATCACPQPACRRMRE